MKVIRKHFSTEQRLLHHMMLHSKDYPNQGLLYGRLGVALVMLKIIDTGVLIVSQKKADDPRCHKRHF